MEDWLCRLYDGLLFMIVGNLVGYLIMRVLSIDHSPVHEICYEMAAPSGHVSRAMLPVYRALIDDLPRELHAVLAASDLQGRELKNDRFSEARLLGEFLAEEFVALGELGGLPHPRNMGVLLGGDLYSRPGLDRRGGMGDVRPVWRAFAQCFRWVAGVAGNHDDFGSSPPGRIFKSFVREPGIHFMDGSNVSLDSLRIGGISGVIGNPKKPYRRHAENYAETMRDVLMDDLDILVLHQSPCIPENSMEGDEVVRQELDRINPGSLVICGHRHWPEPLVTLPNGVQILNVDARVVMLVKPD